MYYFNDDLILLPFFDLVDTANLKLNSLNDNHQHIL